MCSGYTCCLMVKKPPLLLIVFICLFIMVLFTISSLTFAYVLGMLPSVTGKIGELEIGSSAYIQLIYE